MNRLLVIGFALLLAGCGGGSGPPSPGPPPAPPQSWTVTDGDVTLTAEVRFGSSITSITDRHGNQYVDDVDHGRQWQVAYQLDGLDEGENPTEAGSAADAAGPTSTTVILATAVSADSFASSVHPAYWYPYQGATVSQDAISKTVTVGWRGLSNVVRWDVAIDLAAPHSFGVFEGLAGQGPMLPLLYVQQPDGSFSIVTQTDGGTTAPKTPLIEASVDGSQALGVMATGTDLLWSTFDISGAGINAWGCAGWLQDDLPAGHYARACYVAVGTLAEVEASLTALAAAP